MVKTSELNSFENRFYLLPRENTHLIYTRTVQEALDNLEEYELDKLSEEAITDKIKEYNTEKENNFFDRLKRKDFILIETKIYKIGKYKFANIHTMDYL